MGLIIIDRVKDKNNLIEQGDIILINKDKDVYKAISGNNALYFVNLKSGCFWDALNPLTYRYEDRGCTVESAESYFEQEIRLIKEADYNLTLEIIG